MTNQQILDVINQNIKQNGNEEITGNILNSVLRILLDFVNNGFITINDVIQLLADSKTINIVGSINPSTETESLPNGVYHAQVSGSYPNAGNIVVKEGYYTLLRKKDGVWSLELETKMPMQDLTEIEQNISQLNNSIYGEIIEIPNGYKNNIWDTALGSGYTYYDSRCIVEKKEELKSINVFLKNDGDLEIQLLSVIDKSVLYSEHKNGSVGLNTFIITIPQNINSSFFVAIKTLVAEIGTKFPQESNGTEYWKKNSSNVFERVTWRIGYSINKIANGIENKINSIEILTKSDTTKIQDNLNKSKKIVLDSTSVTIEDTIQVPSGANIEGVFGSTTINIANGIKAFNIENKEDICISKLKFKGTQPNYEYSMNGINDGVGIINNSSEALTDTYMGSEIGLNIVNSESIILSDLQFKNINGIGLKVEGVGRDYIRGLKASKLFFEHCYKAIETKNEHEYSNYTDLMISLCQIGFDQDSGNLNVSNPIITRCRYGMIIRGSGLNHAHGIVNGAEIKHNQLAGVLIDNAEHGHYFNGLMMQYANLEIQNSTKVVIPDLYFTNGLIKCSNVDKIGSNHITNFYKGHGAYVMNSGNLIILNEVDLNA